MTHRKTNPVEIFVSRKSKFNPWGYEQYPQDYTDVFKGILKKAKIEIKKTKDHEILIVWRKSDLLYYSYNYRLKNGGWVCIGLRRDDICLNFMKLYTFFRTFLSQIASQTHIIKEGKGGIYKLTGKKIYTKEKNVIGNLEAYYGDVHVEIENLFSNSLQLSEPKISSGIPTSNRLDYKNSKWFVEKIERGFHIIYIYPPQDNRNQTNKETETFHKQRSNFSQIIKASKNNWPFLWWIGVGGLGISFLSNFIIPWFLPIPLVRLSIPLVLLAGWGILKGINNRIQLGACIAITYLSAILLLFALYYKMRYHGFEPKEPTPIIMHDSIIHHFPIDIHEATQCEITDDDSLTIQEDSILNQDKGSQTDKMQSKKKEKLTQEERFQRAMQSKDWNSLRKMADRGYTDAYGPLARHYMNDQQYDEANKYAQKAKKAGSSEGEKILKELERLDY